MCVIYAKKQHLTRITQSLKILSQNWNTHYKSALTVDKCYLYLGTQAQTRMARSILQQGLVQTSSGLYLWSGEKIDAIIKKGPT